MLLPETLQTIILNSGFITPEDFASAAKTAQDLNKPVADILIFRGLISDDMLGKLVAEHYQVPFISLVNKVLPLETLQLIPEQAANTYHMIPFKVEGRVLHLAMENPKDIEALEFAKRQANLSIKPYYLTQGEFSRVVGQYKKNIRSVFQKIIDENLAKSKTMGITDPQKAAEELPVIKILDTILEYAQAELASDVHIEAL